MIYIGLRTFSVVLNNLCCKTYSMVMIPDFSGELCEDDSEVLVHCIKPSVVLVEAEKLFLFLKVLIKSSQLKCLYGSELKETFY